MLFLGEEAFCSFLLLFFRLRGAPPPLQLKISKTKYIYILILQRQQSSLSIHLFLPPPQGGHAAFPHLDIDPIVAAAAIVGGVQTLVAREISPLGGGGDWKVFFCFYVVVYV